MNSKEWKEVTLGDICVLNYGKALTAKNRIDGDIPVYSSAGITGYHNSPLVESEGIIIGRKGSVGTVYYSVSPFFCIDTAYYVLPNEDYNLKYLFYRLKSLGLENMNEDSAVPGLNRDTAYAQKFLFPPYDEQLRIADTLSSLDGKIEVNNNINKNLEEIAQAIFKSWFVDFEPFQDGKFEDSEFGKIPNGWRVGTISDLGDVIGGSTPSKAQAEYYTDDGIAWITPKDLSINKNKFISKGEIDITDLGLKNSSTKIMPKGTVLFSSRAPIGYIAIAKNDVTTNQGFKSVVPKSNIGTAYIYYFFKNNIEMIESRASGSTFKEVSGSVMKQIPALIPDDNTLKDFQEICNVYFEKQMLLESQNQTLLTLRDALLPKLMSGEIRVPLEEV